MTQPEFKCPPLEGVYTATEVHDALLPDDRHSLNGEDPVADNRRRAGFAAQAVHEYARLTGIASGESVLLAISDLMGDLRHLVDAVRNVDGDNYEADLDALIASGEVHYEAEIRGEL